MLLFVKPTGSTIYWLSHVHPSPPL